MQSYLFSSKGPRLNNQDATSITYIRDGILLCVADGVGGNNGGEVASKLAIETFVYEISKPSSSFRDAVELTHETILKKAHSDENLIGMATTFTAVLISNDKLSGIHCGDSRAYILRDKGLKQLSTDHSEVAKLLREGKLTRETAIDYPRKNLIYSALGSHKELEIDEFEFDLLPKDRVILTTDGVHGLVSKKTIRDTSLDTDSLKEWCDSFVTTLEAIGPSDNYTLAAVEVEYP